MNNRIVVLDTETTGLNARSGDRIIEVGCVELVNRQLTGNNFHSYINPERDSEDGALAGSAILSSKTHWRAQRFCSVRRVESHSRRIHSCDARR